MNRPFQLLRISLSGLLFVSNFLAVLHLHEFFPTEPHLHHKAVFSAVDSNSLHSSSVDSNSLHSSSGVAMYGKPDSSSGEWVYLIEHTGQHAVDKDELTCPFHVISQAFQESPLFCKSFRQSAELRYTIADSQVSGSTLLSSKSNRAPPFFA